MSPRTEVIGQLIRDSHYVIDESAVAQSILMRAIARHVVPEVSFRSASRAPVVRSFRRHRGAPSFRLCSAGREMALRSAA